MSNDDEWMTAAGAAATLNRSDRQLRTYVQQGKLHTRRRGPGGRVEYRAADVYALASELGPGDTPPRVETAEIVPSSALARRVDELTNALLDAQARAERAETALRLLPPPDEAQAWRVELAEQRAQAQGLRAELAAAQGAGRIAWRLVAALVALAALLALGLVLLALFR
jgi:hypothetical protein